ncbi:hypothetical protein KIL84_017029 [Mauremys mutica]|uniref:Uncharacterized protein n=1 Tax=Mauremys mutica TaxID=74926 RepID=A0A9D4AYA4_9SAUR|nr:hypothetical protein KIL84_017029 [Mauremys mutica]
MKQSYSASACVDVSCSIPDLAPALRDIQMESEGIAAKNLQEKTQTLQEELKAMKEKIALHLCD